MSVATSSKSVKRSVSIRDKFVSARAALCRAFIERDEEVDLLMIGLVARENVLFIGPPGVAKSAIQEGLKAWLDGASFSILMHRSVMVDELMGQLSLKVYMEEDSWRRNIAGRLPSAVIAILDEIFKSSPVCLSPLLKILNEHVYEVEGVWHPAPIASVFAASNEYPPDNDSSGIDTSALFDRFAIRAEVSPIQSDAGIDRLLDVHFDDEPARCHESIGVPEFEHTITPEELLKAHEEARAIPWSRAAYSALKNIFKELMDGDGTGKGGGIVVSDRRKRKAIGIAQAAAWLDGSATVNAEHLSCLSTVLWSDHNEQPKRCLKVVTKYANPIKVQVKQCRKEIDNIFMEVDVKNATSVQRSCEKLEEIIIKLQSMKRADMTDSLIGEIRKRTGILKASHAAFDLSRRRSS